jgi:nitronate monooxygenase
MTEIKPLKIGKHTASLAIMQGAMAVRVSGGNLAGSVAKYGGIGMIASLGLGLKSLELKVQKDYFRANKLALIEELNKARLISPQGIIGVNIITAMRDYPDLARTAAANGADLIVAAGGLPLDLPEHVADYPDIALVPMVCGLEALQNICQTWFKRYNRLPDAFVVENSREVGGHIGSTCSESQEPIAKLVAQISQYIQDNFGRQIPLIIAGGIWDQKDFQKMLDLGAQGVLVGTRFITTDECDAQLAYKKFHLYSQQPNKLTIVPSPVGKPARALSNKFTEEIIAQGHISAKKICIANCLSTCLYRDQGETYCIISALAKAQSGDMENGLIFSGSNVGRAKELTSVAQVMRELTYAS